jgi:hypothetical protein
VVICLNPNLGWGSPLPASAKKSPKTSASPPRNIAVDSPPDRWGPKRNDSVRSENDTTAPVRNDQHDRTLPQRAESWGAYDNSRRDYRRREDHQQPIEYDAYKGAGYSQSYFNSSSSRQTSQQLPHNSNYSKDNYSSAKNPSEPPVDRERISDHRDRERNHDVRGEGYDRGRISDLNKTTVERNGSDKIPSEPSADRERNHDVRGGGYDRGIITDRDKTTVERNDINHIGGRDIPSEYRDRSDGNPHNSKIDTTREGKSRDVTARTAREGYSRSNVPVKSVEPNRSYGYRDHKANDTRTEVYSRASNRGW